MAQATVYTYEQFPRVWHNLLNCLGRHGISYENICQRFVNNETDFPVSLENLLYQHYYNLEDSPTIDVKVLYQLWLYFRLNDEVALREYPCTGLLETEFSCTDDQIHDYACLYQGFFKTLFRTLLSTPGREKQLFFILINDENCHHFMVRSKYGILEIYEIESTVGLEMRHRFADSNKMMYTVFSTSV